MERIGEKLRKRREELGFTIEDIAKATKYRPDVIRAIEEGRSGVFPAGAYRQAFLRAYAGKLGLDAAEILREQKSEEERIQEALKGIRVRPGKNTGMRRTAIWLVAVVGVAVALLLFYDRVVKVRVMSRPTEDTVHPRGAVAESTDTQRPDSARATELEDSIGTGAELEDGASTEEDDLTGVESRGRTDPSGNLSGPGVTGGAVTGGSEDRRAEAVEEGAVAESGGPLEEVAADAAGTGRRAGVETRDWLAVSVRDYAVRARLFAGDSLLVDRWLRSGFRDTFYSSQPFWADTIITQENAISLVLNGEIVDLPKTQGNVITGFRISP